MQVTDPWAQPNTPPSDPWNGSAGAGAIAKPSNPLDGWLPRTHSPSIVSVASNDPSNDPWLSKPHPPRPDHTDPWQNKPISAVSLEGAWSQSAVKPADPWTPSANNVSVSE